MPNATGPSNPSVMLDDPNSIPFSVPPASLLQERPRRTIKHDDSFAVFDCNGDALPNAGSQEGLYHRDTRYLSAFLLTINGERPILLSSTLRNDNATLTCDLTNPQLPGEHGEPSLSNDQLHIRRSRFLWQSTCFERLSIRNFNEAGCHVRLAIAFAADFADLFEVRGTQRKGRGTDHPPAVRQDSVTLSYTGLDDTRRQTHCRFEPAPTELTGSVAVFDLELAPGETKRLFIEIACNTAPSPLRASRAFSVALRDARRLLRQAQSRTAKILSANDVFNEAITRSGADLRMLVTDTPQGPYPYAGIPWFSTAFGRDGLITAMEVLWFDPDMARGVLGFLADNQATEIDPAADAEPGKILHETRQGEMAVLGEVPFRRYYGSIDSTPLFIMLAGGYLERTGDLAFLERIWPNIQAGLAWIDEYGDRDGDGFVEYGRQTSEGLINQGWKDSHDSIFHANGTSAKGPIALVEVQAYVYGAWCAAAEIGAQLGYSDLAADLHARACSLRDRFDKAFFDAELGTYVLALDGDKKPCRVRTSNAGHALFTGIALPERAAAVAATLMDRASFSGWGVRTVATSEARYNPMSYHNGSVWPHDNALIGAGLARYGFRRAAARIFEGLFAASTYIEHRRLPELFCGFPRQRSHGPTFYPVACSPQAWAAAAPFSLIQSCVGLRFDVRAQQIIFDRPIVPEFLGKLVLKSLSVGGASMDVALKRAGSEVSATILSRTEAAGLMILS